MKRRAVRGLLATIIAAAVLRALGAVAAEAVLTRQGDLRADRFIDAAIIRSLDEGTRVDIVKTDAGWVQVRVAAAGGNSSSLGWLRATSLAGEGAARSAFALLESGRGASGNLVVAAGIRRIPKASHLALIIAVDATASDGRAPTRWPGVALDVESARLMAQRFAIPDDNIEVVRGKDATLSAVTDALDRLARRTQPGDQVFIYFSGPGTLVSSAASNGCDASWVAADGRSLTAPALAVQLKPILANADKVFVVSDAGFASTTGASPAARLASKQVASPSSARCDAQRVASVMPLVDAALALGAAQSNIVHVQSAPGTSQGVDQPLAGGVFTQLLADCVLGDAADRDGSGSVSVAELVACANRWSARGRRDAAASASMDNIAAVSGNAGYSPLQGTVAMTAAPASTSADVEPIAKASAIAAIDDVLAQGDGRISVQLTAVPPALRIGRDYLDLQLKSSHDGFVYLILLGSDEKSFYLLFPNALDRDNRIAAGQTLQLPRPSWRIQSQGPPGRDVLLGVVAESERELASIEREKNGPFTTVLSDLQGRAQLQWLLGRSGVAETQSCVASGRQRNLGAVKVCSDAFGAVRLDVVER